MLSTISIIKITGLIHFIVMGIALVAPALVSSNSGLLYCNVVFIATLFWTLHSKESVEATQAALYTDISSIFIELLGIVFCITLGNIWILIFAIINIIVRPISVYCLFIEHGYREGNIIRKTATIQQEEKIEIHP